MIQLAKRATNEAIAAIAATLTAKSQRTASVVYTHDWAACCGAP